MLRLPLGTGIVHVAEVNDVTLSVPRALHPLSDSRGHLHCVRTTVSPVTHQNDTRIVSKSVRFWIGLRQCKPSTLEVFRDNIGQYRQPLRVREIEVSQAFFDPAVSTALDQLFNGQRWLPCCSQRLN